MKFTLLGALISFALMARLSAIDAPPTNVVIIEHSKVAEAFAKGRPLEINSAYKLQAGRRESPGQVEIHTNDTDIFYITEGTATLITGGTAIDPKQAAPGEFRADKSTGGVTHHIAKGDVIVIPAGVSHWMSEVSNPFLYFIVKVTK